MARNENNGWTVRAIGVTFKNGVRQEKPLEMFTEAEKREIAARKNMEALEAAGYRPAAKQAVAAM